MSGEKVIERLFDFGFSRDEAEVYLLLLRTGPCTASVVSRTLGLNRVKAYRILESLGKRGVLEIILGRPAKFAATSLKKMTDRLMEEERTKLSDMEKGRDEIIEYWKKTQSRVEALEEPRFRILQGRKVIYDFLLQMFERAKATIWVMTTRNDLHRFSFHDIDDKLKNLDFNHFAKRVLTQVDQHGLEVVEDYLGFAEVRHVIMPAAIRFVIIDESEVLNTFAMDDSMSMTTQKDIGLWTNAYNYVKAMTVFFDSLWTSAPDAREVLDALKAGRAPEEVKITGTQEEYENVCKAMIESSKEEVFILKKNIRETPVNMQDLQAISDRGVKIRLLTQFDLDSLPDIDKLSKLAQVRHNTTATKLQIFIADKREALVHFPHLKTSGYSMWSNLKPHVQTVIQIFEDHWVNGVLAQEILPKLVTRQTLTEGLMLAKKSLEDRGWIVEVPGELISEKGGKHSFSLVAKFLDRPTSSFVLDLLVEDDALGQLVTLDTKVMDDKPFLKILAATRPFHREEARLADLYGIKLVQAVKPKKLAKEILKEANRILRK
jgi:sugar-specific transcriptional regulator TrmB